MLTEIHPGNVQWIREINIRKCLAPVSDDQLFGERFRQFVQEILFLHDRVVV